MSGIILTRDLVMERVREPSPVAEREKEKWPQTVGEFEAMVERFQDRLLRYAFHRLGSREDAEEVVQEVFTRAYAGRDEFAKVNRVSPYLFRMAANLCTDFLRKRNPAQLPLDAIDVETIPANSTNSPRSMPGSIERRQIELLLLRLPRREAEVIRLRVFGELQFDEIAELLVRSVPTIKSRFRYGLQRLRKMMAKQGRVPS